MRGEAPFGKDQPADSGTLFGQFMQDVIGLITRKASHDFPLVFIFIFIFLPLGPWTSTDRAKAFAIVSTGWGLSISVCFKFARVRVLRGGRSPAGGA